MKKFKLITCIVICTLMIILLGTTNIQASSDLFLENLNFDAHINSDGSMDVTETWNIDISDTNTVYKTFKTDKSKYSRISNVNVTDITNGRNTELSKSNVWKYHLDKNTFFGGTNDDGLFEIAWGVGLEDKREAKQYKISYKVEDAISKHSDYAQLYWQFVGEDFEISSKKVKGTIYLPEKVSSKEEIKVWGHTEDLNGEIYATDLNKIDFEVTNFNSGRYIEIRTLFPTELISTSARGDSSKILSKVISEETTWAEKANSRREFNKNIKIFIVATINIVAIIMIIFFIKSIIKNYKKSKGLIKFLPEQEFKYYREMPREDATPAQALSLYNKTLGIFSGSDIGKIFSASLLDLNLKNILEFKINDKNNITIVLKSAKKTEISEDEKVILDYITESIKQSGEANSEISIKELEKHIKKSESKIIKLKQAIENESEEILYKKELANKKQNEEYKSYSNKIVLDIMILFFALFTIIFMVYISGIMGLVCIIPLIITIIADIIVTSNLKSKINIFTQKGIDEQNKWKALKKYMDDFSMLEKREVPEIVIWKKFLVYATVFGIADKVLKQLKIVYPDIDEIVNVNTYAYMYLMLNTNFSSNFTNTLNNSISSAYSSATGGGGGFSSGGGGRRWSEVGGGGR